MHKANINAKDNKIFITLHVITTNEHETIVRLLLKNKLNINVKCDIKETTLHIAIRHDHEIIM
jgi:ankyrin repeat protein